MGKKWNLFFWVIVSIVVFVLSVLHPRLNNVLLLLFCIIKCITLFITKKEIEGKVIWKKNLELMIVLAFVWYMGSYLNILYPYHAVYEYKNDIARCKTGNTGVYYTEFPDLLPDGAEKVKWICCPSLMQGSGYNVLFFYTDKNYIEELYGKYADAATTYTYSNYGWENKKTGKSVTFPKTIEMTEEEKMDVTVFVTYDNGDINHPHSSGLYINQAECYVGFYTQ
ncbi:MAG: hypothetical protein NC225_07915 [Clostridium sp.]|nr:hypothetical protein [Clostridium sp.]MCM1460569.1 hypothetical protein [Bacteroides sp.]